MSSPLPNLDYMIANEIKMQLLRVKRNKEALENYRRTFSRSIETMKERRTCSCRCKSYSKLASKEEIKRRTKLLKRLEIEERICEMQ